MSRNCVILYFHNLELMGESMSRPVGIDLSWIKTRELNFNSKTMLLINYVIFVILCAMCCNEIIVNEGCGHDSS